MFANLKKPKSLTQYKLMRGVTDFGNLNQFNLYESGYSFLIVCQIPKFMETLANQNTDFKNLVDNYVHILEYEFRGLDGIENITSDTLEITDGISNLNMISKVTEQSASTVSMRFFEKSGSSITKFHEAFLHGIKDPRTQIKRYHGLIDSGALEAGYENEVFTFLYFVTDNTATQIEKAYLLLSAQPTSAETSIYNSEKGSIENKEITVEFNCYPVKGEKIYEKAKQMLDWMNNKENTNKLIVDSNNFEYTGINKVPVPAKSNGVVE